MEKNENKVLKQFNREELEKLSFVYLREIGRAVGVKSPSSSNKDYIIDMIMQIQAGEKEPSPKSKKGAPVKFKVDLSEYYIDEFEEYPTPTEEDGFATLNDHKVEGSPIATGGEYSDNGYFVTEGVFEQNSAGFGFLRCGESETAKDIYVSAQQIRRLNIREGDLVKGYAKPMKEGSPALVCATFINDLPAEYFAGRVEFDSLTPCYPCEKLKLEITGENDLSKRIIDLFSPIGKGQRGLIVAPPKAGKTTILKKIASSIEINHPQVKLFVILIDERPEEVTDFTRSISCSVIASTFDQSPEHHIKVAEKTLNRAKRLVEAGQDVVILMDSITKLARAYNTMTASSGKTLSGGIDPLALTPPKKFFGSARNIENGGSLTVVSTALVETGSRMDDVIYEEFKGTGNMELHLSRELAEKRVFPAIDIFRSGTRKEELLLSEEELDAIVKIRKILRDSGDATDSLISMLKKTNTNADFIKKADTWIKIYNK